MLESVLEFSRDFCCTEGSLDEGTCANVRCCLHGIMSLASVTGRGLTCRVRQVALWAWDIVVDNCAICRNHIMDLCEFAMHLLAAFELVALQRRSDVFYAAP